MTPKPDKELGKINPGEKYNHLIAVRYERTDINARGQRLPCWSFVCDCGAQIIARVNAVKTGKKQSCGCMNLRRPHRHLEPEAPKVVLVTRDYFKLEDGRVFEHLFRWSYRPPLADFRVLVAACPDLTMDENRLIICP